MHLRCVAGWRLMNGSMSPSPRGRCMGGVVVAREQPRLHGAPHRLRVGVFLRVLHAFGSAEAGSGVVPSSHSFVAFRVESPSSRVERVTAALHGHHNACDTHNSPACDSGVHDAMQRVIRLGTNSGNSENSLGDTEAGGQRFCVPG